MSAIVVSVEYQVGGGPSEPTLARFLTAMERAGAEVLDVGKHILPKLLPVLEVETGKQFDAQGAGPIAGSWAPLSVSYAKWKAAHFPGKPILERTGALRNALTKAGGNALRSVTGDTLEFGTAGLPYASFHQTGTTNRRSGPLRPGEVLRGTGRMPARPEFDYGPDFEAAMQAAAEEGLRAAIKAGSDGLIDFEGNTFEGLPVLTGKRGGRFVVGSNGSRTYLKSAADGRVVQRTFP